jgi:hypothetical protein
MTPRLPILFLLLSVTLSHGATNYVRAGATAGTKGGTNWANAFTNIPISLTRGDTYYVAEGNYGYVGYGGYSYGAYEFNDSGTSIITLRKATAADHGTESGWDNAYGDSQAVFIGGITFWKAYYAIDGNGRNESNWQDGASYGFYIPSITIDTGNGQYGSQVSITNVEIGEPYTETEQAGYDQVLKLAYDITNWVVSACYIHNYGGGMTGMQLAGGGNYLIESNYFGPGWGKEAIRGANYVTNCVIRYNVFRDSSQPHSPEGITAEIAIWDGNAGASFKDISIYGNVFTNKYTGTRNGVILLGPYDGRTGNADNAKIYNNTFIGVLDTTAYSMIHVGGPNAHVVNNLFYNCAESDISVTNGTTANNLAIGSNVFSGYTITAAIPGTSLSDPYNRDPLGVTRGADGVFDIGAYEYSAGGGGGGSSGATWNVTNLRIGQ